MDGDLEDLIQGIFTQVVEYYKGCISNEVLHDAESNDWLSSNPYYENQKISTCIQFWAYTMQGIRADIFNVLNESLARKALHEITKRSLDILAVRYCQVKPSNRRLAQFRADISVILYVAHDMLLSLIPDLNTLFHPDPRNISARSIHQKCLTLLLAQVMIGAPMKNMDRYVEAQVAPQDNPGVPARLEPMQKVIFVHFRRVLLKLKLIMFYRMRLKNWHVGYIYPFLGFTVTLWNDWILLHSCLYWEESQLYNLVLIGLS